MRKSTTLHGGAAMSLTLLLLVLSPAPSVGQQEREWPPSSVVQAHLDSVLTVALSSPNLDERRTAITRIMSVGSISAMLPGEPYPGVVRRLQTIYEQEPTYWLRSYIVRRLDDLGERVEKLAFLRMVASERRAEEDAVDFPVPLIAVGKLARMGPEGQAILQELAAQNAVKHPIARIRLKKLQERGWEPSPRR